MSHICDARARQEKLIVNVFTASQAAFIKALVPHFSLKAVSLRIYADIFPNEYHL